MKYIVRIESVQAEGEDQADTFGGIRKEFHPWPPMQI